MGYDESEISSAINEITAENKIRDIIISKLKAKYLLTKYCEDFPAMIYSLNDVNCNIFIEHDCSRWINIYKDDRSNYVLFDPLDDDCLEKITSHIDSLMKSISI